MTKFASTSWIFQVILVIFISIALELQPAFSTTDCLYALIDCSKQLSSSAVETATGNSTTPENRAANCELYNTDYKECTKKKILRKCNVETEYVMMNRLIKNGFGRFCGDSDPQELIYKEYQKQAVCYNKYLTMAECIHGSLPGFGSAQAPDNEGDLCKPSIEMVTCVRDGVKKDCGEEAVKLALLLLPATFPLEFTTCVVNAESLDDKTLDFYQQMTDDDGTKMTKPYISWISQVSGAATSSHALAQASVLLSVGFWILSRSTS